MTFNICVKYDNESGNLCIIWAIYKVCYVQMVCLHLCMVACYWPFTTFFLIDWLSVPTCFAYAVYGYSLHMDLCFTICNVDITTSPFLWYLRSFQYWHYFLVGVPFITSSSLHCSDVSSTMIADLCLPSFISVTLLSLICHFVYVCLC